jgi:hypothetical protein
VDARHNAERQAIEELFARCPELYGFSVQSKLADAPREEEADEELFVTAIGIAPRINAEQYGLIFEQIASTLAELLEERPESSEFLRGRTFARALH